MRKLPAKKRKSISKVKVVLSPPTALEIDPTAANPHHRFFKIHECEDKYCLLSGSREW